jgi:hypothetical protein
MASRKRPHDSTNGINHDLEGINIRNGDSNSSSLPESSYTKSNNRPVSNGHAIDPLPSYFSPALSIIKNIDKLKKFKQLKNSHVI